MFTVAEQFGVTDIYFCGSVAGPVPHTREPRLRASVSEPALKDEARTVGAEFSNYEGPASVVTFLTQQSAERGIRMRSLVVEVPHYPFLSLSTYPRSIIRTVSALNQLLSLDLDLSDLQESMAKTDTKLNDLREENEDFAKLVAKLERVYDEEESEEEDEELLRRLIDGLGLEAEDD